MSTLGALVHDVEHAKSSTAVSNEAFIVAVLKLKSSWKAEAPMLWSAVANTSAQHSVTEACPPCRPHCLRSLSSQSCSVSWPRDGSRLPKVPTRRERPHTLQGCLGHVFTPFRRLIRTSILLTLTCCYLMWTVTYLAQVHPLESKYYHVVCRRAVSWTCYVCRSKAVSCGGVR